jgi:hypothetical protein
MGERAGEGRGARGSRSRDKRETCGGRRGSQCRLAARMGAADLSAPARVPGLKARGEREVRFNHCGVAPTMLRK